MIALTFVPSSSVTSIRTPTSGTSLFACSLCSVALRLVSTFEHDNPCCQSWHGACPSAAQRTARSITRTPEQCQIARRMCFIAALLRSLLDEPADGPSFQAELAFPYDSFVRLV
jgi:hypothetical protein